MRVMKSAWLLGLIGLVLAPAWAEEGMWLLDKLPEETLEAEYGFTVTPDWQAKLQKASLRLAGGCSGAFVSEEGLVLTNQHCVTRCLAQLSGRQHNLLESGYLAQQRDQELICPEVEINQLLEMRDVSASIQQTAAELSPPQAALARKAAMSDLESRCSQNDPGLRCDVVTLYGGGRYHLYKYRRYQDVRLVFAPEAAIAQFGGDPDNFSFPRYVLDMALLRVYENGAPLASPDFFPPRREGAEENELVFVTGHPGRTQRDLTVAQLITLRDLILPQRMGYLAELRGVLRQFASQGPEHKRISQREYLAIENTLKAFRGQHLALTEPGFMEVRRSEEQALRKAVEKNRSLRKSAGKAWDEIERAQQTWRSLYTEYSLMELMRGFQSDLLSMARHLVRAAQERERANTQRLREYTDAALPQLTQHLFSAAPIHRELEMLTLEWSLEKLRELLGPDHPSVRSALSGDSPARVARRLIQGTRLDDLNLRKALWDGGLSAINESQDPLILFARTIDDSARAIRQRYEEQVEAIEERNASLISQAGFDLFGTQNYPDASFTLRLSYGQIKGWKQQTTDISAFTSVGGLLARASGYSPYALPPSWQRHDTALPMDTPMNFVSTHDIIGGNSGSPMLNRSGELVGLIFDGNMHALGGAYAYDGRYNRAIAVHPAVMHMALERIYQAPALLAELFPAR